MVTEPSDKPQALSSDDSKVAPPPRRRAKAPSRLPGCSLRRAGEPTFSFCPVEAGTQTTDTVQPYELMDSATLMDSTSCTFRPLSWTLTSSAAFVARLTTVRSTGPTSLLTPPEMHREYSLRNGETLFR
jgi:hypothetical protein